jgi:hypothetical protein
MERPSNIPRSVFDDVARKGSVFQARQQVAEMQKRENAAAELEQKRREAIIANPYKANAINKAFGMVTGADPVAEMTQGGQTVPGGQSYESLLQVFGGDEALARDEYTRQRDRSKTSGEDANKLRTEFAALPISKELAAIEPQLESLKQLKSRPGKAADIPFIYGFMKMMDPSGVVRESDAGFVIESQSLPTSLISRVNGMLSGSQGLTEQARQELIDIADSHVGAKRSAAEILKSDYMNRAKAVGIEGFDLELPGTTVRSIVRSEAKALGIDPDLAEKIAATESSFSQSAVSPKGAMGVMQLMPGTAAELGVDPKDLKQNIRGGLRYFKQMKDRFGSDALALAAYNAGPGALQEALSSGQPLPEETQKYVKKITAKTSSGAEGRVGELVAKKKAIQEALAAKATAKG